MQQLDDKLSFTDGGGVPPHYDTCIYLFISVKDSIFLQFLTRASPCKALCVSEIKIIIVE